MLLRPISQPFKYRGFNPREMFASSEVGFIFDPSVMSSLWQNSTRTTPVTAVGDPIGAWDDLSGNGFHALQSVSGSRPTWGRQPRTGVRNLLTYTEQFDNASWTKNTSTIVPNAGTAPDGTLTADLFYPNSSGGAATRFILQRAIAPSAVYTWQISVAASGKTAAAVYGANGTTLAAYINLSTGAASSVAVGYTVSTVAEAFGNWRVTVTSPATADPYLLIAAVDAVGSTTVTASGTDGILLSMASLNSGASAAAYQKVTGAWDVTESGVESIPLVWFDGIADHLVMTATAADIARNRDHFAVVAGAEITDTATNKPIFLASTGALATAGRIFLSTSTAEQCVAGGTRTDADVYAQIVSAQGAGSPFVQSGIFDYQNTTLRLRQNAVQTAISTTFQTAGSTSNTASLAVFIGRVSASYLSGKLFSLVGISSRQMTTAELLNTERWTASKSGVTL